MSVPRWGRSPLYSPYCLVAAFSEVARAALSSLTSSEVYERSVEGHHGSVEGESFAKVV
jgi:hypothetical protein